MIGAGKHPVTGNPSFYGLGWSIDTDTYGEHWSHNGAFTSGVRTVVDLLPEADLGIVVLTNGFPSGAPEGIVASFYELVFAGELTQDWTSVYDDVFKSGYQQFIDTMAAPFSAAPANSTPALPLASYTGTFSNGYVGEAEVIDEDGAPRDRFGSERREAVSVDPFRSRYIPLRARSGNTSAEAPSALHYRPGPAGYRAADGHDRRHEPVSHETHPLASPTTDLKMPGRVHQIGGLALSSPSSQKTEREIRKASALTQELRPAHG